MKIRRTLQTCILACGLGLLAVLPAIVNADEERQSKIVRDEYGVPHIFSDSEYSLWYASGYAQAADRLWQADLMRRTAQGRLAELLGPGYLSGDIFARTVFGGETRLAELMADAPEAMLEQANAFSDGVNAWIAKATEEGKLPLEYVANGITPQAWSAADSAAIAQFIAGQFGQDGADELENAAQLASVVAIHGLEEGRKVFQDAHWINDGDAKTTVPASGAINPVKKKYRHREYEDRHYRKGHSHWKKMREGWQANLDLLGIHSSAASNAIVISPKMSADGHALLLGGPQMGYTVPQITMEMGLHYDDLQVTGISFPGLPGIAIGVTKQFAWTFTSGLSDVADIYVDSVADMRCRIESFQIAGVGEHAETVCSTSHGPVIAADIAQGVVFSLKRAADGYEMESFDALQRMQLAGTITEVGEIMKKWSPNFNMLVADKHGNIAYWHMGNVPVRAEGDNPWLPHAGDGSAEWQGFVPREQLPHSLNPDQGWLANWNNKPRADWNNAVTSIGAWGPVHRINALTNMLEQVKPGTVTVEMLADMNRRAAHTLQTPTSRAHWVFAPVLMQTMLSYLDDSADARIPVIKDLLAQWDGLQMDADMDGRYDHPGVSIFNIWFESFAQRVFKDDLGALYRGLLKADLTYRLLVDDASTPLLHDYLDGLTRSEAITTAMIAALDRMTDVYASDDPQNWLQVASTTNWDQIGAADVPDTPWMNRGTYNQIVHLGRGREMYGMNVVAPGQSGDPRSPHFADQLMLYASWQYKPMRLRHHDIKDVAVSEQILTP